MGERLPWLSEPSMRHYVTGWELKQAGLDWRSLLLSRCLSGRALLVAQLKADPGYTSEAERVQAFLAQGGGSPSTYFNWSRKLPAHVKAPPIRLDNAPPARQATDAMLPRLQRKWNSHFRDN